MGLAIVGMDFMVHIVNINNALKIAIKEEIAQELLILLVNAILATKV